MSKRNAVHWTLIFLCPAFGIAALYGNLGETWAAILGIVAGLCGGSVLGLTYGIERLHEEITGRTPSNAEHNQILKRLLK